MFSAGQYYINHATYHRTTVNLTVKAQGREMKYRFPVNLLCLCTLINCKLFLIKLRFLSITAYKRSLVVKINDEEEPEDETEELDR